MIRFMLLSLLFVIGCNSRQTSAGDHHDVGKDTASGDTYISTTPIPWAGCYSQVIGRDSATLKLDLTGDRVTGSLVYNRFEKDDNTGTLDGEIIDNILYADYTFRAEGMTSVREVAFKIKGDTLIEGDGDFDTIGDTVRFKNRSQLTYNDKQAFVKTACK